jgi:hypothetical protein
MQGCRPTHSLWPAADPVLLLCPKTPLCSSPRLRVSAVKLFFLRVFSVSQCLRGGFCFFFGLKGAFLGKARFVINWLILCEELIKWLLNLLRLVVTGGKVETATEVVQLFQRASCRASGGLPLSNRWQKRPGTSSSQSRWLPFAIASGGPPSSFF